MIVGGQTQVRDLVLGELLGLVHNLATVVSLGFVVPYGRVAISS